MRARAACCAARRALSDTPHHHSQYRRRRRKNEIDVAALDNAIAQSLELTREFVDERVLHPSVTHSRSGVITFLVRFGKLLREEETAARSTTAETATGAVALAQSDAVAPEYQAMATAHGVEVAREQQAADGVPSRADGRRANRVRSRRLVWDDERREREASYVREFVVHAALLVRRFWEMSSYTCTSDYDEELAQVRESMDKVDEEAAAAVERMLRTERVREFDAAAMPPPPPRSPLPQTGPPPPQRAPPQQTAPLPPQRPPSPQTAPPGAVAAAKAAGAAAQGASTPASPAPPPPRASRSPAPQPPSTPPTPQLQVGSAAVAAAAAAAAERWTPGPDEELDAIEREAQDVHPLTDSQLHDLMDEAERGGAGK